MKLDLEQFSENAIEQKKLSYIDHERGLNSFLNDEQIGIYYRLKHDAFFSDKYYSINYGSEQELSHRMKIPRSKLLTLLNKLIRHEKIDWNKEERKIKIFRHIDHNQKKTG